MSQPANTPATIHGVPFLDTQKVKSFDDRILVFPDDKTDTILPSGLVIPSTMKDPPKRGIVVLVGPAVADEIAVGDRAIYGRHSGQPVEIAGVTYESVRPTECIVFLREGATEGDVVVRERSIMSL